jgi:hypothetical protein
MTTEKVRELNPEELAQVSGGVITMTVTAWTNSPFAGAGGRPPIHAPLQG